MGCDIHLHIEVKIDNVWHHYAAPNISRNYMFFKILGECGRHPNLPTLFPERPLPKDVTLITYLHAEAWAMDAHGLSWIADEEISQLKNMLNILYCEKCGFDFAEESADNFINRIKHRTPAFSGMCEKCFAQPLEYDLEYAFLKTNLFGIDFDHKWRYGVDKIEGQTPIKAVQSVRFIFWFDN